MADGPTADDYVAALQYRFGLIRDELLHEINRIHDQATKAGSFGGSRTALQVAAAARKSFKSIAEMVFGEEKRCELLPAMLDDLEPHTEVQLNSFVQDIEQEAIGHMSRGMRNNASALDIAAREMPLRDDLKVYLRLHRAGMFTPAAPAPLPNVTHNNTMHIGQAHGAAIQQGSHGSSIHMESHVNLQDAAKAVEALDRELSAFEGTSDAVDELRADSAAVKLQLQKKSPALEVLKQIGVSIRNVAEGAVGGALSGPIITAAAALAATLGG